MNQDNHLPPSFAEDGIALLRQLGAEQAAILVPDKSGFVSIAEHHVNGTGPSVSTTLLRKAIAEDGPLLMTDVTNTDVSDVQSNTLIQLKSALIVKVKDSGGEIAAILYGDSRIGEQTFQNSEMHKALAFVTNVERQLKGSAIRESFAKRDRKRAREESNAVSQMGQAQLKLLKLGRPGRGALSIFFRSMASMLDAGITSFRAVDVLAAHSEDQAVVKACMLMSKRLKEGVQLSTAMTAFPTVFRSLHVNLVKLGEETGRMGEAIHSLGEIEEKIASIDMKVRSALTYPTLVFVICTIGAIFGPPYLLEGHFEMIRSSGVEPPLLTKLVMAFSTAAGSPVAYLVMGLTILVVWRSWFEIQKSPAKRLAFTRLTHRVPVLGNFLKTSAVTRFAQAFAVALDVGVRADKAMLLAGAASGDVVLERDLIMCRQALIQEGKSISESLAESEFFPPLLLQMVAVGEETADLPRMMGWVSGLYETQMEASIETFTAMLEPLVMAFVGAIVAILVLAAMLPLVQVLSTF